jgi:predicted ester cyclase
LTVGVLGALLSPQAAALGVLALIAHQCTIDIAEVAPGDGAGDEADWRDVAEAAVRRYVEAGQHSDLAVWDEVCDPDMVLSVAGFPSALRGLSAVKQFNTMLRIAFPDFHQSIEDIVADTQSVTVRWIGRGTHSGVLLSPVGIVTPTGRAITLEGTSTFRLRDGRIVEERLQIDVAGLLRELGVAQGGR